MAIPIALGSALIGAGSSLINGISSLFGAKKANRQAFENTRQLAAEQYARQRELTLDSALLNKSSMLKAGMSPASMNGSFSVANTPLPSTPPVLSESPDLSGLSQNLLSALIAPSQINLNNSSAVNQRASANTSDALRDTLVVAERARANLLNKQSDLVSSQKNLTDEDTYFRNLMNGISSSTADIQIKQIIQNLNESRIRTDLLDIEKSIQSKNLGFLDAEKTLNLSLLSASIKELQSRRVLNMASSKEVFSRIALNYASADQIKVLTPVLFDEKNLENRHRARDPRFSSLYDKDNEYIFDKILQATSLFSGVAGAIGGFK